MPDKGVIQCRKGVITLSVMESGSIRSRSNPSVSYAQLHHAERDDYIGVEVREIPEAARFQKTQLAPER